MSSNHLPNYKSSYNQLVKDLLESHDQEQAMSLAVGGEFKAFGLLEFYLLLDHKLEKHHNVVDVGCGSGRLAVHLAPFLKGHYTGIDVVPEVIEYAKKITQRSDWDFLITESLKIPATNNSADFICFFSVFTHLLHEESYRYLEDANRVLKPGGRIIFSFLEFSVNSQWALFKGAVEDTRPNKVLTQFLGRDAIEAWAKHIGLTIAAIYEGDKPHFPLPQPIKFENGSEMREMGCLGQSVCVLTKD
jgi:SAM-dependent methyltransferase